MTSKEEQRSNSTSIPPSQPIPTINLITAPLEVTTSRHSQDKAHERVFIGRRLPTRTTSKKEFNELIKSEKARLARNIARAAQMANVAALPGPEIPLDRRSTSPILVYSINSRQSTVSDHSWTEGRLYEQLCRDPYMRVSRKAIEGKSVVEVYQKDIFNERERDEYKDYPNMSSWIGTIRLDAKERNRTWLYIVSRRNSLYKEHRRPMFDLLESGTLDGVNGSWKRKCITSEENDHEAGQRRDNVRTQGDALLAPPPELARSKSH
ncbi:hypothetical protein K402DRAFT_404204 [Aulographum hederae CBS 113979]|uniref:Uncharacterized protein n=1 Tax=Aulographum hederae CBS 113979 TaxID=1176131 RepID=A0A6G1H147_9PEZI|nr:hypothetical protein K402DRAFT_404204 [Aulographum hederae CBS 113979]